MIHTFIIDVDDTVLTTPLNEDGKYDYEKSTPIAASVERIRSLKQEDHQIILFTARGSRTFNGDLKKIKKEYHKNGFFIIKNFFKKTKSHNLLKCGIYIIWCCVNLIVLHFSKINLT